MSKNVLKWSTYGLKPCFTTPNGLTNSTIILGNDLEIFGTVEFPNQGLKTAFSKVMWLETSKRNLWTFSTNGRYKRQAREKRGLFTRGPIIIPCCIKYYYHYMLYVD